MKLTKKRSKKAGLPPGALVHIGEQRRKEVRITLIDYDETGFEEREITGVSQCIPFRDRPTVTWINIEGLHQEKILAELGGCFGLHPLILEDILNTDQRPKMEDFKEYLYAVLKMLYYDDATGTITIEQISLVLGGNFVLSFQEGIEGDVFNAVREHLRKDIGRIRKMGTDYLFYSLMDAIVDNYFLILEKTGDRIEFIEEELVSTPTPGTLQAIHRLKREMIFLRKSVWPLREVISSLERGESSLIRSSTGIYLRDVYDHTIQVIDTVETFRDVVSGMIDIYLSSISNRLNEVMKILTIITTLFMPLSLISGIYGMNFKYMPELDSSWGYPAVLLSMLVIALFMLFFFKRKKWL
ncbi:MAG: magnesium/cobalt transporter CorA [Alphaproteobacteria bacterium]|uniref:Magnesium transport protein CorA n=1 Tax=Candidatus Nitrobium versatile TaxID=2884831 RepID=A0A953J4C5_9BACT|nr:magnesium/cobalt transporter CorA [Candidatus Nitrobium versatile]